MLHRPDHNGQALAYVYFEDEPGRRGGGRRAAHPQRGRCIAANIAKLPDLLRHPPRPDVDTVNGRSVIIPKLLLNMINAGSRPCA